MFTWLVVRYRRVRHRRGYTLGCVFLVLLACVVGNACTFIYFDGPTKSELTFADALWYSAISITTIGYGDISASTPGARVGTIVFIVVLGLSTFTVFFGMLIDWATELAVRGQFGMTTVHAQDHILVVNYPGTPRVRQLIDELRSDVSHRHREIVLLTDDLEKLPFTMDRVSFVRGSPLHSETYERACLSTAAMVLVLAT